MTTKPTFFAKPEDFRRWLQEHHESEKELLVGFYKTGSGKPSITWPQSVDEALCFGWIDGVRRRIDDESYSIRFTPRKPTSNWSAVNVKRIGELMAEGRVAPAGKRAFEKRSDKKTGIYAYEQRHQIELDPAFEKELRRNAAAWRYFEAEAPWYRRLVIFRTMSAKKEETRWKRLRELIESCAAGRRLGILEQRPAKKAAAPTADAKAGAAKKPKGAAGRAAASKAAAPAKKRSPRR
ncbi:MAG TPA: YdeI/OmpD-associated family protein [Thermoanaerobaculia bacterium]|nr:YdeI/OmpD-associated family protein [Thermoanaerobaculia bacterium]